MLHVASLMAATSTFMATMISPSKNACRVAVSAPAASVANAVGAAARQWYRNDPYNWRALSSPAKACISPNVALAKKTASAAAPASPVPHANRLLYAQIASSPAAVAQEAAPAPRALATSSVRYAFVQFKHESCTYLAPFKISVGDYVVVEGDRGEDLGRVTEITTEKPSYPVPSKVVRKASRRDMELLEAKNFKEAQTRRSCQALAESIGLNIDVVDVEFQFDYNKLTVYFGSKQHHIDFRKLQRGLFREFRCRIWLSNMAEVETQQQLPRAR